MRCSALLALAVFCWSNSLAVAQEKKEQAAYVEWPYYPRKVGSQWHYRALQIKDGQPMNKAGNAPKVLITAEKEVDLPFKDISKDGKEIVTMMVRCTRLKVESGEKTLYEDVGILNNGIYRFKAADKEIIPPLLLWKFDLKDNNSWKVSSQSEGKKLEGTFTAEGAMVKLPGGQMAKGIHIASKDFQIDDTKMQIEYWFAPEVGLVRQRVKIGGNEVILELEK